MRGLTLCFAALLLVGGCAQPIAAPVSRPRATWVFPPERRVEAWTADIDALSRELPKRHKNAFFKCSNQEFEGAASTLRQEVPKLSDSAVVVGMMKLAAMLGDAHTSVSAWEVAPGFRRFPIEIYNFKEGAVVVMAPESRRDLIGCKLVRWGGVAIEDAFERVSKVSAYENAATYKSSVARSLPYVEIDQALGLVDLDERLAVEVRDDDGQSRTVELSPRRAGEKMARENFDANLLAVSRRPHQSANWFERVPGEKAIFVKYDTCNDEAGQTVAKLCDEVLKALDADKPERLIIDFRGNGGGNSGLIHPLFWGLKWRSWFGGRVRVFALIGRNTFSSAFMNAVELRSSLGAILIGEPTGQKPNAYGEVRTFSLPRSGITVRYSTRFWRSVSGDPESLNPDILVEETAADYFSGRDAALEKALACDLKN